MVFLEYWQVQTRWVFAQTITYFSDMGTHDLLICMPELKNFRAQGIPVYIRQMISACLAMLQLFHVIPFKFEIIKLIVG